MSDYGPSYLVTRDGVYWLHESRQAEDLICALVEVYSDQSEEPLTLLSRQQVAARLGRGLPADFPRADVVAGDPNQGGTRCWFEATVQRYLGQVGAEPEGPEPGVDEAQTDTTPEESDDGSDGWAVRSRRWTDVDYSGVDQRILIAASKGLVTPSGVVKSGPLRRPERLGEVVCNRQWGSPPSGPAPQIWVTPEALEDLGFPVDGLEPSEVPGTVADFFGCEVTFNQSGWFGCAFDSAIYGGTSRSADIILMPFMALDPSTARPEDRGMAGQEGTDTELPDDEDEAIHLLGDRIAWLFGLEGIVPASRWTLVGAQLLDVKSGKAKPKPKSGKGSAPELKSSPLPPEINTGALLSGQWWTRNETGVDHAGDDAERPGDLITKRRHRKRGQTALVTVDQLAAYLPSAEGLFLGYGPAQWVEPDPSVFNDPRPPFSVVQLTTPPGKDLDLYRRLPLPHPLMKWDQSSTFWATTADVRQLTAVVAAGGAGIAWTELQIDAAWVWPEQHQWLKGFGQELRSKRLEAEAAGRQDYQEMIKAIYTSTFGRMAATGGERAWKHPYIRFTQPAWYASIEAVTRQRAMKYAVRIADAHNLYPIGWWADAWYYQVPATDFDIAALEDPLRNGVRTNGSYRVKDVDYPVADA